MWNLQCEDITCTMLFTIMVRSLIPGITVFIYFFIKNVYLATNVPP